MIVDVTWSIWGNISGISPAIPSNNLFTVSQSVVPKVCPSSETKYTLVALIVLGLTLCALLFVCLPWPFDLHILAKCPTLSHLWHITFSALHSPFLWFFPHLWHLNWPLLSDCFLTALMDVVAMVLNVCTLASDASQDLSQHILLACVALLVVALSALLSFGFIPQCISLTSTLNLPPSAFVYNLHNSFDIHMFYWNYPLANVKLF